jgi:integrase
MPRRKTLTDAMIVALKPDHKPNPLPDPELTGHYIRIGRTRKTFAAVARAPSGRQIWHTIGQASVYSIAEAREKAREAIKAIREGRDRNGAESFETVAEAWFKRHVEARGLISSPNIRSCLDRQLIPAWNGRDFASIRRSDVAKMLDAIEDSNGPVAADNALAIVSAVANWFAARHEDYASPIVKGMRRTNPKQRARSRLLNDDEIREIWRVAEANGTFGAFVRVALLCGQRRAKIVQMRWADLNLETGEWRIPKAEREKGTPPSLTLPDTALAIIEAQPRLASNEYVFSGRTVKWMQAIGKRKAQFDAKLNGVGPYTIHDLRRSCRSLMARAGVLPHIAERVLGHAVNGVEGIYDRNGYGVEMGTALRMLAGLIDNILRGDSEKVRMLRGA